MAVSFRQPAALVAAALQQWYRADSYASSTGLYHNYEGGLGSSLIYLTGYSDVYQDTTCWWNSANAITALIDYMLITGDCTYASAVKQTFDTAQNAYTFQPASAIGGAAVGLVVGFVVGGPVGALLGALLGGGVAAATFARVYYTNFLNQYYDDEGWWALAWIKAFDLTNDQNYLSMAETIFGDMTNGWDASVAGFGGGIYWKKDKTDGNGHFPYKNAIANELFLAIAAALSVRFQNLGQAAKVQNYLNNWALPQWKWFSQIGLINPKNLVNDSLTTLDNPNSLSGVNDGTEPIFSYNQGVILGALCDLFKATNDSTHLQAAANIADAFILTHVDPKSLVDPNSTKTVPTSGIDENSVLTEYRDLKPDYSDTNYPQFKGIFVRNLGYLYRMMHKRTYREFLINNAKFAINKMNSANQVGSRWDRCTDKSDFMRQTSALDLLNAAMAVQSADLSYLVPVLL